LGKKTAQNQMYRHEQLDVFAIGKEESEHFWNALIRQMTMEGLLEKDIEDYGVLKITAKGLAFHKEPSSFTIILNSTFEDSDDDDEETTEVAGPPVIDPTLLAKLKELRQKVAKEKKLPPFVIFLENSLEDMAIQYPISMEALEKISGVSKGKAIRYGEQFVDLIKHYVEDNQIEIPDDFVMRSLVNKSSNKVFIILQVDKKIPLESIAKGKDLSMEKLYDEMETIVASGTKLNLDYAINQLVDEDDQIDILDYFKSCETSSLEVAKEELSDLDLEMDQLKIMRIKFLSTFGN
jgi:ATP-dependent DNA helicase RecQ